MKNLLCLVACLAVLSACKKEIDIDYHEVSPMVVIEGRVTNEGTEVLVTRSRAVEDSVRSQGLNGARVLVTSGDAAELIPFDTATGLYRSSFCGEPGHTYKLTVDFDGQHYEGMSTMPQPAPIMSSRFLWQDVLDNRLLVYELWAADPEPAVRNYYWYRMDRASQHPHLKDKPAHDAYRWSVFDDRGMPPGLLFRDVVCTSEKVMDEDEEDNWKDIIYEGDVVTFRLMAIDFPTYDYLRSLRAGQSGGANPRSNLTGGCLGYFAAASVTRADTLVFRKP